MTDIAKRKDGRHYVTDWIIVPGNGPDNLGPMDFNGSTIVAPGSLKGRLIRWLARTPLFERGRKDEVANCTVTVSPDGKRMVTVPREGRDGQ